LPTDHPYQKQIRDFIGSLSASFRREGTPGHEAFAPFLEAWGGVLRPHRRRGVASALLRTLLALMEAHGKSVATIKAHLPEIRNAVLLLLSSKTIETLSTIEQKNQLRAEIREAVNKPLGINTPAPKLDAPKADAIGEAHAAEPAKGEAAKGAEHKADEEGGVVEVLLTSFVIQ